MDAAGARFQPGPNAGTERELCSATALADGRFLLTGGYSTRQRKTLPGFEQTFKKLVENIEAFDVAKVRYEDIQRSAIMGAPAAG